ncbi:MAG: multiubiquitin domain-containing protein [Alphaproteobacteria bacterium]|nr:multiubiquitin domain-containing protein [Alphaproteobacteria bacterium]
MNEHHHEAHKHHPDHEKFRLIVDNREHKWPVEHITGLEIKELAKVDVKTYSVWEVIPGPGDDTEIDDGTEVDLKIGPKEHVKKFITGKKHSTEG